MGHKRLAAVSTVGFVALACAAPAAADTTLGSLTIPAMTNPFACGPGGGIEFAQIASDPSTPFAAPSDGFLTSWSVNTSQNATPGSAVALLVVNPANNMLTAMDSQTLPATLPAITTFVVAQPVPIAAGEVLGVTATSPTNTSGLTCSWSNGPAADVNQEYNALSPFGPGRTLPPYGSSPAGSVTNISAQFVNTQDAGVTTAAGPSNAVAGGLAKLTSTVTNAGPLVQPITFTDTVPTGMTVDSSSSGAGDCSTAGQTVTCTLTGIAIGQSATVTVLATPAAAGAYTNHVGVSVSPLQDPVASNNSASAPLTVGAAPVTTTTTPATTVTTTVTTQTPPACTVPTLRGMPVALARRVLGLLNCTVGATAKKHSKIRKGEVISTTPAAGNQPAGTAVSLIVSSGPAHKKHR